MKKSKTFIENMVLFITLLRNRILWSSESGFAAARMAKELVRVRLAAFSSMRGAACPSPKRLHPDAWAAAPFEN